MTIINVPCEAILRKTSAHVEVKNVRGLQIAFRFGELKLQFLLTKCWTVSFYIKLVEIGIIQEASYIKWNMLVFLLRFTEVPEFVSISSLMTASWCELIKSAFF